MNCFISADVRGAGHRRSFAGRVSGSALRFYLVIPSRDEASARAEGKIGPRPVEGHGQAVASTDQERQVSHTPQPPCDRSAYPDPAKLSDSRLASDRRQAAEMIADEGTEVRPSENPSGDHFRDLGPPVLG